MGSRRFSSCDWPKIAFSSTNPALIHRRPRNTVKSAAATALDPDVHCQRRRRCGSKQRAVNIHKNLRELSDLRCQILRIVGRERRMRQYALAKRTRRVEGRTNCLRSLNNRVTPTRHARNLHEPSSIFACLPPYPRHRE